MRLNAKRVSYSVAAAYSPFYGALLAAVLLLTSFARAGAAGQPLTVRIYNWIEYLPQEVLDSFERETGIHPVYTQFDSVEAMEAKLLTGNSGYDVVFPGTYSLDKLVVAGALEPLQREWLANWHHLDQSFMSHLEVAGDPGNRYAVPYLWGTTLIGYNVEKLMQALGPDADKDATELLEAAPRPNAVMFMPPAVRQTLFSLEPVGAPIERVRARIWRETTKPPLSEAATSACTAGELECLS